MSSFNFIPSVSPMWKYLVKLFVSKAFQNHRSRWVLPWATTSWKYITLGQVVNYTGWSLQDNTEFSMYYSPNPKKGTICTSQSNSAFLHCSPLDIDILSSFSFHRRQSQSIYSSLGSDFGILALKQFGDYKSITWIIYQSYVSWQPSTTTSVNRQWN